MAAAIDRRSTPQPISRTPSCRYGWWSVIRFGLSTILISLIVSLIVTPLLPSFTWWKIFRRCVSIAAAVSLWLNITRWDRRSVWSYGLERWAEGKSHLLFGLFLGTGTLAFMLLLGLATGVCRIQITPDGMKLWRTVLTFIPAACLVSVLEELVFRGYLLQQLLSCSKTLAVMVSSAVYSLVHLKTRTWDQPTYFELTGLMILGVILALTYLWTRRLSLAIGLHAAFAYGARVNKLIISFDDQSLGWLTGTSRLINGVASWVILVVMAVIIWFWVKRSHVQGGMSHA